MIDEVILEEIPESWEWIDIKSNIEKITLTGKKLKKGDYQENGVFPVIDQGQDFIGGYTDKNEFKIVSDSPLIIFGDHTRCFKYVDFDFVPGADGIKVIKPSKVFNPKLFFYLLKAVKLPNKGYARHFQYLEKSFVPLPPFNEQIRIVSKIEELFTKLDAGNQELTLAKEKLKIYRQSVLKHAFEGKLTEKWREAHKYDIEPASTLLKKIQKNLKKKGKKELPQLDTSALWDLPDGWKWTYMQNIGDVSGGLTKNSKRKNLHLILPYLRVANVYAARLDLEEIKTIGVNKTELERVTLKKGDLLVVEGNGSKNQIGRVALWDGSIKPCLHQNHLIKVRFDPVDIANYVLRWLMSISGREQILRVASSTSGLYTLNLTKVSALPVPLPPLEEQFEIIGIIEREFSIINNMVTVVDQTLIQVQKLRQNILKKAFSGQLVVQDPTDEPAEKLLERIKAENAKQNSKRKTRKKFKSKQKRRV